MTTRTPLDPRPCRTKAEAALDGAVRALEAMIGRPREFDMAAAVRQVIADVRNLVPEAGR